MKGTIKVLDRTGHTEVAFDTDDLATVEKAQEVFRYEVEGKWGLAFDAGTKERIRTFNPETQEEVIITPQFVGG